MRKISTSAAIALATFGTLIPVQTVQGQSVSYCAHLNRSDHYNTNGQRLSTPAQIIHQDRTNFHRFGIRDAWDQSDPYYSNANNRAILERKVNNTRLSNWEHNTIVNGTPFVCIQVFQTLVNIIFPE